VARAPEDDEVPKLRKAVPSGGHKGREVTTLRAAIVTILAADFAMSLENILGVGAAPHENIALLLFGLGLSIPIVLFGSGLVVGLLDRFPQATWVGALAILWTAADLVVSEPALASLHQLPFVELLLTLGFLGIVVAARFRHVVLAQVGARPRPADERARRPS
jgi:predicted tellurium resistance membrane protein TerC